MYLFILAALGLLALRGLSLVAAGGGGGCLPCSAWASQGSGLLLVEHRLQVVGLPLLQPMGLEAAAACRIFPDQGPNPCPLYWQVDFYPLWHPGSPTHYHLKISKGEKERYTHLNAEFQRIARRDKKAFLSDQFKEIEETIEWERLEISSRKLEILKEHFHSNPKERQCQRMLKLPHNCTHLTC